ncbi:MAG: hypothetical protein ACK55Z_01490 [bacterium]
MSDPQILPLDVHLAPSSRCPTTRSFTQCASLMHVSTGCLFHLRTLACAQSGGARLVRNPL